MSSALLGRVEGPLAKSKDGGNASSEEGVILRRAGVHCEIESEGHEGKVPDRNRWGLP